MNEAKRTVLIVDDAAMNLAVLGELLQDKYRVLVANSGSSGLRIAQAKPAPDLILLDIMMPDLDGYQMLDRLQSNPATASIPVIFMTALADAGSEERGLRLGAVDYISKPFKAAVVLARVRAQLQAKLAREWMDARNHELEAEVQRRIRENDATQRVSIRALAHLAETRDPETGNHILRTQAYVQCLALGLRSHPRFAIVNGDRYVELLALSAPLHDIGKVGIPDHVLLKPGKLTPEEWEIMKTHAELGCAAIEQAETDIEMPLEFLTLAKEIARSHHERWDGGGYPDGLSGEAIPVSARLMALADVFDALISKRVYKHALSFEQARDIIIEGSGRHFDPDVVSCFMAVFDDFQAIARRYSDALPP